MERIETLAAVDRRMTRRESHRMDQVVPLEMDVIEP